MYREHLYARLTHACMYAAERLRYSAKIKSAKTFLLNSHPAKFMYTHYNYTMLVKNSFLVHVY